MQQLKGWQAWVAVAAIFFVSLNLRPAVTSIGPILNTITTELAITNTQVSLLTAIPVFCMGLFAPLAVPVQKKLGYRFAINLLLALIGLATVARFSFNSYTALLLTSFAAGFAIAIISPMINAFIKEKFPHKMEPIIGVYALAMGAGAMISAGLTSVFFEVFRSWQVALGLWGILIVPAIILWAIAARGGTAGAEERIAVQAARNPWKTKSAWLILLFFGLQTSLFFSLTTWLAPIAQEQGFSLVMAGSVLTTMSFVQIIGNLLIPMLINKWPNRIIWLYLLLVIGIIGAAILLINADWAIWAGSVILGISLSGLFPIGLMLPLDEARNQTEAGSWSSMVLSGGFMMSAIVPLLIGVVYDVTATHEMTKWIIVILYLLIFISVFLLQQHRKQFKGE